MGTVVHYKQYSQNRHVRETMTPSDTNVPLAERSFTTDEIIESEGHCADCYHMRSNWSKFLDWLRRVLWVM